MSDYTNLIKSIKIKTKVLLAVFLLLEVLLFFVLPSIIYFLVVSSLVFCVYILLLSKVSLPIYDSLNKECDPVKFKQLFFSDANKTKGGISALSANFNISFLTGDYDEALDFAKQMIADGRFNAVVSGLSNKAIAEFFKGDYDSLNQTVEKYNKKISDTKNIKRNEMLLYTNNMNRLDLYVAVANNNINQIQKISEQLKSTNNTIISNVQIKFLKALCAYKLNDIESFNICFDFVKKHGSKTVYFSYLSTYNI